MSSARFTYKQHEVERIKEVLREINAPDDVVDAIVSRSAILGYSSRNFTKENRIRELDDLSARDRETENVASALRTVLSVLEGDPDRGGSWPDIHCFEDEIEAEGDEVVDEIFELVVMKNLVQAEPFLIRVLKAYETAIQLKAESPSDIFKKPSPSRSYRQFLCETVSGLWVRAGGSVNHSNQYRRFFEAVLKPILTDSAVISETNVAWTEGLLSQHVNTYMRNNKIFGTRGPQRKT